MVNTGSRPKDFRDGQLDFSHAFIRNDPLFTKKCGFTIPTVLLKPGVAGRGLGPKVMPGAGESQISLAALFIRNVRSLLLPPVVID